MQQLVMRIYYVDSLDEQKIDEHVWRNKASKADYIRHGMTFTSKILSKEQIMSPDEFLHFLERILNNINTTHTKGNAMDDNFDVSKLAFEISILKKSDMVDALEKCYDSYDEKLRGHRYASTNDVMRQIGNGKFLKKIASLTSESGICNRENLKQQLRVKCNNLMWEMLIKDKSVMHVRFPQQSSEFELDLFERDKFILSSKMRKISHDWFVLTRVAFMPNFQSVFPKLAESFNMFMAKFV